NAKVAKNLEQLISGALGIRPIDLLRPGPLSRRGSPYLAHDRRGSAKANVLIVIRNAERHLVPQDGLILGSADHIRECGIARHVELTRAGDDRGEAGSNDLVATLHQSLHNDETLVEVDVFDLQHGCELGPAKPRRDA